MSRTYAVGGDARIHSAIGVSVHAYSFVEAAQVAIVQAILKIHLVQASILFHSIQNVRTRNEMIQGLLRWDHGTKFKPFWAKCSAFLFKLSVYRNAIVHWHPHTNVYVDAKGEIAKLSNAIGDPKYGKGGHYLEFEDFAPFDSDCTYIRAILEDFAEFLKTIKPAEPLPDKYLRPIIRPNRAALPQHRTPTTRQPRTRSSQVKAQPPKVSAAQRRKRAMASVNRRG